MSQTDEGLRKTAVRFERKATRLAAHIAGLIDQNANLRYEMKRLERTLVWIHKTEQPIEEIRRVIEKTIPTRLRREKDAEA